MRVEHRETPRFEERVKGVAILLDSAPRTWTSMEEINLRLTRRLTERGIRVVLVYADTLPPDLERRMRAGGADIEIAAYRQNPYYFFRSLGRIFRTHAVAMVHVCFFDYFSLVPWLARLQGVRSILYEELNSGMLNARSWRRLLVRMRTRATTLPMKSVIAVSEFVRGDLVKRGVRADRIVVRHLGADENRFCPDPTARERWARRFAVRPGEVLLSTVTLLRPFKNPATLVEACAVLSQRGVPARLFVAGDGAMLPDLKALSERRGVADRIVWLGFCADPADLMKASDMFLLASVGEAGGFVLSEAMGCGIPIVGSRSGVIGECVEDGHTGLLVTPKDPSAFADAVQALAQDEPRRRAMGQNARARMVSQFTTDINVGRTLEIYESLWQN